MTFVDQFTMLRAGSSESNETSKVESRANNLFTPWIPLRRHWDFGDIFTHSPNDCLAPACGGVLDEKLAEILSLAHTQPRSRFLRQKLPRVSRNYSTSAYLKPRPALGRHYRFGGVPCIASLVVATSVRDGDRR